VFEEMDLDHDGVITGQQLHEALAKMGATISERDVAEFLKVSKVCPHDTGQPYCLCWDCCW
jgi:Ca2+-binding EF-hand superfamily protein